MPAPKPIRILSGANPTPIVDPQEFILAGSLPAGAIPAAGSSRGGVTRAPAQANSTATEVAGLVVDFNALLAKLRTAGVIAP